MSTGQLLGWKKLDEISSFGHHLYETNFARTVDCSTTSAKYPGTSKRLELENSGVKLTFQILRIWRSLSPVISIFLDWWLKRDPRQLPSDQIIPKELLFLTDPMPIIPPLREICMLSFRFFHLTIASQTNELKLLRISRPTQHVQITVRVRRQRQREKKFDKFPVGMSSGRVIQSIALAKSKAGKFGKPMGCKGATPDNSNIPRFMTTLAWNARGIARDEFRSNFLHLVNTHKPDISIISEAKVRRVNAEKIISGLPFDSHAIVEPVGLSGGIIILWNSMNINFTVVKQEKQMISGVAQGAKGTDLMVSNSV